MGDKLEFDLSIVDPLTFEETLIVSTTRVVDGMPLNAATYTAKVGVVEDGGQLHTYQRVIRNVNTRKDNPLSVLRAVLDELPEEAFQLEQELGTSDVARRQPRALQALHEAGPHSQPDH